MRGSYYLFFCLGKSIGKTSEQGLTGDPYVWTNFLRNRSRQTSLSLVERLVRLISQGIAILCHFRIPSQPDNAPIRASISFRQL